MQKTRNRQAEKDLHDKDEASCELSAKSVKAVTKERELRGGGGGNDKVSLEIKPDKTRGYQQREKRLGDKRDRTEAEAGNRKTAEKRDNFSGDIRTRVRRQPGSQEQLQHAENGDCKTLWDHKDWGENHVNNHHRRP